MNQRPIHPANNGMPPTAPCPRHGIPIPPGMSGCVICINEAKAAAAQDQKAGNSAVNQHTMAPSEFNRLTARNDLQDGGPLADISLDADGTLHVKINRGRVTRVVLE
jgi:hypothetical protein